jgi:hypothetical protein
VANISADTQNLNFMTYSYESFGKMNAQNGNSYAAGSVINFDAPIISGAWATSLIFRANLAVDVTLGAGTATLNAGSFYNAFSNVQVIFGNTQINVHPYFTKVLRELRGYNRTLTQSALGASSSTIQDMLYKSPTLADGVNNWTFEIEIPLNGLNEKSIVGILPMFSTGTKLQAAITCAPAFTGADPLNHTVKVSGGAAASVSGSVDCVVVYRDYRSMSMTNAIQPNMAGQPTLQIIKPQEINPLTGGSYVYKRLTNPYGMARVISVVIDGKQSDKFTVASNIKGYEIDAAENTNSQFLAYDNTTGGIENYYRQVRKRYGQDIGDDGVLFFDAIAQNCHDASNGQGLALLNLTQSGYPAARFGYNVGDVNNGNGITPRVVTFAQIINTGGISIA